MRFKRFGALEDEPPVEALVVHADHLPGWATAGAFLRHLMLVAQVQRLIKRVAVVSPQQLSKTLLTFVLQPIIGAEVRAFDSDQLADALSWAAGSDLHAAQRQMERNVRRDLDRIDEASLESFPASDPPAYTQ